MVARERRSEEERDRLARLPLPEMPPDHPLSPVRGYFEIPLSTSTDDEDAG